MQESSFVLTGLLLFVTPSEQAPMRNNIVPKQALIAKIVRLLKISAVDNMVYIVLFHLIYLKGQIISEQICGVLKFSKKATKYCQDFCPKAKLF